MGHDGPASLVIYDSYNANTKNDAGDQTRNFTLESHPNIKRLLKHLFLRGRESLRGRFAKGADAVRL